MTETQKADISQDYRRMIFESFIIFLIFDIPLGRYANPTICDEQTIISYGEILNVYNYV